MKIVITAANGGLGSATIKALKELVSSENIIGLARTPKKAAHLGIEVRHGDYDKPDTLHQSFKGCDVLMVISSYAEASRRIEQHRDMIAAAQANNIKKIVYSSIIGDPKSSAFAPIVKSNRQTEEDMANCGIPYVVGRNGLYIDPDLEALEDYKKEGKIRNSAANGKCAYTSRQELGNAYARILTNDKLNNKIFNLTGTAIDQNELAQALNRTFDLNLTFENMSVEAYLEERRAALGEYLGTIVGGIYESIRNGAFDVPSDFEKVVGRKHKTIDEMMATFKHE